MDEPTPEQLAGNWNHVARLYAQNIDPATAHYAVDVVELASVAATDLVLDVASGYGAVTLLAAQRATEVVAVDFSSEMCAALRERSDSAGTDNVVVREMDAQALDFPDDVFDAALSSFGVMIVPDRSEAFAEMARVTRPGGHLVVSSWQPPPNNDWMEIFLETVSTALPDVTPTPPKFMELADPSRLRSEVEAAGWGDVDVVGVTHQAPWEEVDTAWAAIAESNPVFGPMLEQLPAEAVARLRSTFDEILESRGDVGVSAGAWLASGRA